MLTIILSIIILIWLAIALIIDLKIREIPDWLTYSLGILAIITYSILSIESKSFKPIISSIVSGIIFTAISFALYYTRQWGGGDVKLFISLGLALPFYPLDLLSYFSPNLNLYFPLIVIINTLIAAMLYSIFALIFLIIKHWKAFKEEIKTNNQKYLKLICISLAVIIFIASFFLEYLQSLYSIALAVLILITPYLISSTRAIEKTAMIKHTSVEKSLGEWLAEDIIIKGKIILSKHHPEITSNDIKLLKHHHIDKIKIKIGIPFAPVFLLAVILTLILGNILFLIF